MEPPRENFDNAVNAITSVFIVTLGEDWPGVMYNYTRVYNHSWLIMLYFIITYSIGNFMLLSLFTAVLLSRFEESNDDEDEKEATFEEEKNDENSSKLHKKPFFMKLRAFSRSIKLEYYKAFAMDPRVVKQIIM